ncbi:DegT/DnrJ/EryC1/StrS family aminotransferase [Paenactinomyces guangxiensis]|uniref:Aminotransferase class I/II-fold pyridoxal phosphate-dependent enzyme n=1 Tax=Paenactinomyces guangxiensis TaxID=1490290 RepID=A0A7W2A8Y1_9BACL|nr:aminotransferase class I/II-fold pyridoxal phosphate-dependent enzyme [Paenactinomyces guangxiensis]MBA4494328.1 aminotransferase class I/II-fold pyridoxal phosphate-dependent enzyme [Paenactinomyces guangxiensis]MBH8590823.1 aminotransferase class I/II-fold pyridoxal phosphate-dependent enzyme [Paenactinomyces guangxiensis]
MTKIPFLRPNLVKREEFSQYFSEIEESRIYSNYGPINTRFESRVLNEYFDNIGAVTTVNNATIGLMLAISKCKRSKGKYALMPSFTFAATPLAAMWCGLEPYFIDIYSDDWCMNKELLSDLLKRLGDQIAIVIPYATFGTNLDLRYYREIHESGIPVVVDAAASFGTMGDKGKGHFGKNFPGIVVFSFHATKSFGIGEGGLLYSANIKLIRKIRQAANFGFSIERESTLQGLNGKMSEYSAAIALSTLKVFPQKLKTRMKIHQWYLEKLNQKKLLEKGWHVQKTNGKIAYQFMPALCPEGQSNIDFIQRLANKKIEARTYFSPACHQQSQFKSCPHTSLFVTENLSKRIISLPLWEEMDLNHVIFVIEGICD